MRPGDNVTVHTATVGNYTGRLHALSDTNIVLCNVTNHNGIHHDQVRIYLPEVKLIKIS